MKTVKYVRRPSYVDAVRVTSDTIAEIALWCSGTVKLADIIKPNRSSNYILVDVPKATNQRQREAYVGDWVLKIGNEFRVYADHAFRKNFRESVDQPRRPQNRDGHVRLENAA
jgi:hypothetical protein